MLKYIVALASLITIINAQQITTEGKWKLVGATEGINVNEVFTDAKIESIWSYNESEQTWNLFSKNITTPTGGINKLNFIDSGEGFWIKTSEPITLDTTTLQTVTPLDKNYLVGSTFYYLDKNISTKLYEENLTLSTETNNSQENNNSYYSDFIQNSIYFGDDYIRFNDDNNKTFKYISLTPNKLKIYDESLKDSTLTINGFTNISDINVSLKFNPQNPYNDSNSTNMLNGTFTLTKDHKNFFAQPLNTYESNNSIKNISLDLFSNNNYMMYGEVLSTDLNGSWNNIPIIDINASLSLGKHITLSAKRSAKTIYLYDHNITDYNISSLTIPEPQGVRIQFLPYNNNSKISNILYSKNHNILAVELSDANIYYFNSKPKEYIVLDINNPFIPKNVEIEFKDLNTTYNDLINVINFNMP